MHCTIQTYHPPSALLVSWANAIRGTAARWEGIVLPRVLVVDDDPLVCATIEVCLRRQGFEVAVADGGESGMRALESSDFDVMLIDVFMPHMRGLEFDPDISRAQT